MIFEWALQQRSATVLPAIELRLYVPFDTGRFGDVLPSQSLGLILNHFHPSFVVREPGKSGSVYRRS